MNLAKLQTVSYLCKLVEKVKCLIVGGGPAGYTAAIYAVRASLSPVLYEGPQPGGQLVTTTLVENYPGFENGIDPITLTMSMRAQAVRLGAEIRSGSVSEVDFSSRPFRLVIDGEETLEADSVIIATGATARYIGLESEKKYIGRGVSACATCDGFFYRGKDVAVVGGGDSACTEALYLSTLCRKVYMIVRRDVFRASEHEASKVLATENIEVLWNCTPSEVLGNGQFVTGVKISRKDGEIFDIDVSGIFVAVGRHPNSDVFSAYVPTDESGCIKTLPGTQQTEIDGVFAAGDVADPVYRQAIVAAASGCKAALEVEKYLSK